MDPAQAVQLVSAGLRTAASVGKFMEARNQRKAAEARRAGGAGAARPAATAGATRVVRRPVANAAAGQVAAAPATVQYVTVAAPEPAVPVVTAEELAERADNARRDIFIVLGILGEKLLALGVVNDPWLPFAREEALKAFRMKGPLLATMFETEMEEVMQYAVTAALFLCAGCWPMHVYRGFGACVLNDWLWGCPDPTYGAGRPEEAECNVVDQCLALLKTATQGHEVLKGYPVGLNKLAPNYTKVSSDDERWYHDAKNGNMKKRGMPLAMDGTFIVHEVIWPWSHYNSGFAIQNSFTYEWSKMGTPLSWQQDPGRMIYAFTIGGFLELQPGQMIEPVNEVTTSILWWLYGLNGTTFKLILQGQLGVHHWKLKPKYQVKWNNELGKAVYAIRDEQRVQMRNAVRQAMPPGMGMPGGPLPAQHPTPPQTMQQPVQQIPGQAPISPTSSIPGYPPAFTPAPGASPWQPPQAISAGRPSPSTTASSPAQYTASPGAGEAIYAQPGAVQSAPTFGPDGSVQYPQQYQQFPQQGYQQYPQMPVQQTPGPVHTGSWPAPVQRADSMPVVGSVAAQPGIPQPQQYSQQPPYGMVQQPGMPVQPGYPQPGQVMGATPAPQQFYQQQPPPQQQPQGYFPPQATPQQPELTTAFNNLSIAPPTQQPPQSAPPTTHPPPSQAPTPAPPTTSTSPPPIAQPQPVAPAARSVSWAADASAWTESAGLEVVQAPPPGQKKLEVLYDFVGRTTGEMSVKKGDVLEELRGPAGDGWVVARKGDEEGRVPEAYVKGV